MKKNIRNFITAAFVLGLVGMMLWTPNTVYAEEEASEPAKAATSISISPVSKILQLQPNTVYEDSFKVINNGTDDMPFEVYASPYSYTYSEEMGEYQLGFSRENNYTQITRWITFKDTSGQYVSNPKFTAKPGESVEVNYRITTPESLPSGGQYAVLFAHTLSSSTTSGGIKTEASPGLVVYGRASGETISTSEVSDMVIRQSITDAEGNTKNIINASGKVKNTGNVDFTASGILKVEGLFGSVYYETPADESLLSVIPDSELTISGKWENTPYFGIFRATWTISAAGESEVVSHIILILPAPIIVAIILLLTIIIVWITIMVRKRKERRSRFMI